MAKKVGTLKARNKAFAKRKNVTARRYDQSQKNRADVNRTLRTGPHAGEGYSPLKKQKIRKPKLPRKKR